jgi:hypothetical protein
MAKKLISSFAVFALLLSLTALGFAQQGSESSVKGGLSGVVVDPTDAVVSGAKVTITGPTGDRSMQTDQQGRFQFQVLTPGFYSIKIEKEGFKATDIKQAEVQTGRTSSVSVKMELGSSSTVVEVSGASVTVDTTSTATDSNLTDTFYQSIPVGRGVTGLFYAAPGVTSGGGTGTANPSIAGGTGLENNYVADGVSITDGGFGGIGVYSRNYGSLSTGINLSFVKEVQVKTGGFEAQYGKSTGGIVQIVTKSGTNQFHGSLGGYFAPQQMEATRLFSDDFAAGTQNTLFNRQGKILHQSNYDVDAQVGGHVPGLKDHLFFYGSFNPQWNTDYDQFAQFLNPSDTGTAGLGSATQTSLGNRDISVKVYSYAGKGTFRLNDHHQFEVSLFGDPTYGDFNPNGNNGLTTASSSTFDKLQYGTRNLVGRYNGTLSATWLFNASFTWGHNNLSDTPFDNNPGNFSISDQTQRNPCFGTGTLLNTACTSTSNPLRGIYQRQGLGYYENTQGDNYGLNFDTQKTFNFLGQHSVSFGYKYDRSHYDGTKGYTGGRIAYNAADAAAAVAGVSDPGLQATLTNALLANGTTASYYLRTSGAWCNGAAQPFGAELFIPGMNGCGDGGTGVRLIQVRGEFGNLNFKTTSRYHTVFAQDAWSPSKYVTINAGLRWEQQHVQGVNAAYTFNDNWSPRLGVSVDPWGNRKTKVTANFGRYTEALPLDIAIRSLSAEYDTPQTIIAPPTDGAGHVLVKADGTLDFSNFSMANNFDPYLASGLAFFNGGVSAQSSVAFGKGTRSEYLDEFQLGFEHEFGNSGVIFTTHYTDRRIKRIIEDNAALSPEAYNAGLGQQYFISNPNKNQDLFTNPIQADYNSATGACPYNTTTYTDPFDIQGITDSNGTPIFTSTGADSMCIKPGPYANGHGPGDPFSDGTPDGFVDPVRKYQAMEFEVNKSFSKGWQMRANYRIAKLQGNYEGSFRNDNGQNDPNISSLFDFTRGDFNLLGQQFTPGVLNTDVRHLANGFVSYTFANHAKGLTMGSSVHFQTGIPINNLFAHPAYQNAGEIPFCADNTTNCPSARGSLGRTKDWGSVDYHVDYPIRITEGTRLRLGADLFNIANSKTQLRVNQLAQRAYLVPNADFLKPTGNGPSAVNGNTNPGFQRPFYARMSVKFEF